MWNVIKGQCFFNVTEEWRRFRKGEGKECGRVRGDKRETGRESKKVGEEKEGVEPRKHKWEKLWGKQGAIDVCSQKAILE